MRLKYRSWALPYLLSHKEVVFDRPDIDTPEFLSLFAQPETMLEIGAGKGDFIIEMGLNHPNQRFIAVEKNLSAAAITAKKIVENKLSNVFVIYEDVNNFIEKIPSASIQKIFLNFSDPWPKVRHHKRRLTSEHIIGEYARILVSKGEVRMKTDNVNLFNYSIDNFRAYNWHIRYLSYSYDGKDSYDAISEYERNFRIDGVAICRLVAKKGSKTYVTNPTPTPTV